MAGIPSRCPVCDSGSLDSHQVDNSFARADLVFLTKCMGCGFRFHEYYKFENWEPTSPQVR